MEQANKSATFSISTSTPKTFDEEGFKDLKFVQIGKSVIKETNSDVDERSLQLHDTEH